MRIIGYLTLRKDADIITNYKYELMVLAISILFKNILRPS
jgi:hypothetical protein